MLRRFFDRNNWGLLNNTIQRLIGPLISFPNKIVRTMLPDDFKVSRLITRNRGNHNAKKRISAKMDENTSAKNLTAEFNNKTKKWEAAVKGETNLRRKTGSIRLTALRRCGDGRGA